MRKEVKKQKKKRNRNNRQNNQTQNANAGDQGGCEIMRAGSPDTVTSEDDHKEEQEQEQGGELTAPSKQQKQDALPTSETEKKALPESSAVSNTAEVNLAADARNVNIIDDDEGWVTPRSPRKNRQKNKKHESTKNPADDIGASPESKSTTKSNRGKGESFAAEHAAPRLTHCKVVQGTNLDVGRLCSMVKSPFAGAVVTFSGTTRNNFEGKTVVRLEYEAYASMAEKEMFTIAAQVRERWPDVIGIAMEHKVGMCPILDTSVVIAVSSAHRVAALDAARFAIDTLKAKVPVWKKEVYANDDQKPAWKENAEFFSAENLSIASST